MSRGREYRSTRREEQARQTQSLIRSAARDLFAQRGFSETTVDAIAQQAGVSPATIYATFDSKAGLVSAMLDAIHEEVDIAAQLAEVFAAETPKAQLKLYVSAHCVLFTSGADILRAAMDAMHTAEVKAFSERGDQARRAVIDQLVGMWAARNALRRELSTADAGDRMWLLTTVEAYLKAIDHLQWSPEQYEDWLSRILEAEILEP